MSTRNTGAGAPASAAISERHWPESLTEVPYWVFQDEDVYRAEQERILHGPMWNYLCLEAELTEPGDFCATFIGEQPVLVTRDHDGQIDAFENRCAHRGSLIAMEHYGHTKDFTCVYHAWTYNLQGDLTGVAFEEGINGKGGMSPEFCKAAHSPRRLRLANVHGLIFGSLDNDVPEIEEYLGQEILDRIGRILGGRKPVVLGRFTQSLPNNWKLYMENVKDSYHASILHLFFTTFGLNKLNQKGGIIVSENGGHHVTPIAGAARDVQAVLPGAGLLEHGLDGLHSSHRGHGPWRSAHAGLFDELQETGPVAAHLGPEPVGVLAGLAVGHVEAAGGIAAQTAAQALEPGVECARRPGADGLMSEHRTSALRPGRKHSSAVSCTMQGGTWQRRLVRGGHGPGGRGRRSSPARAGRPDACAGRCAGPG
ncbi:aromatic ring-hydroxylating oxygenase subunit alpha [Streptomyces spiralis]